MNQKEQYKGFVILMRRSPAPDRDTVLRDTEIVCPSGRVVGIAYASPTRYYIEEAREWIDKQVKLKGAESDVRTN